MVLLPDTCRQALACDRLRHPRLRRHRRSVIPKLRGSRSQKALVVVERVETTGRAAPVMGAVAAEMAVGCKGLKGRVSGERRLAGPRTIGGPQARTPRSGLTAEGCVDDASG